MQYLQENLREEKKRTEESRTEESREEETSLRSRPLSALAGDGLLVELREDFPDVDVSRELAKFRDWIKAKRKTYKDYVAAFRNWLRKAQEFQNERTNGNRAAPAKPLKDSPFARYGS